MTEDLIKSVAEDSEPETSAPDPSRRMVFERLAQRLRPQPSTPEQMERDLKLARKFGDKVVGRRGFLGTLVAGTAASTMAYKLGILNIFNRRKPEPRIEGTLTQSPEYPTREEVDDQEAQENINLAGKKLYEGDKELGTALWNIPLGISKDGKPIQIVLIKPDDYDEEIDYEEVVSLAKEATESSLDMFRKAFPLGYLPYTLSLNDKDQSLEVESIAIILGVGVSSHVKLKRIEESAVNVGGIQPSVEQTPKIVPEYIKLEIPKGKDIPENFPIELAYNTLIHEFVHYFFTTGLDSFNSTQKNIPYPVEGFATFVGLIHLMLSKPMHTPTGYLVSITNGSMGDLKNQLFRVKNGKVAVPRFESRDHSDYPTFYFWAGLYEYFKFMAGPEINEYDLVAKIMSIGSQIISKLNDAKIQRESNETSALDLEEALENRMINVYGEVILNEARTIAQGVLENIDNANTSRENILRAETLRTVHLYGIAAIVSPGTFSRFTGGIENQFTPGEENFIFMGKGKFSLSEFYTSVKHQSKIAHKQASDEGVEENISYSSIVFKREKGGEIILIQARSHIVGNAEVDEEEGLMEVEIDEGEILYCFAGRHWGISALNRLYLRNNR